ncbi:tetratricopeptide repeat protein [Pigmentibacter sp. JX0631]|uniref:tetratricopeptide repeat protein n=1 Tax=Pigmentibacter sp. JX0631 TaxID=2976982 RepID=UPI002469192E|nr:tetratricopeptide repeat protein [Pigmentibacter sp. JX0631]WGL58864.1 tetratricopeptide repeat protein [Pigmentibacter sp. JX0631]
MKKSNILKIISISCVVGLFSSCMTSSNSSDSIKYITMGNKYAEKGDFSRSAEQYRTALKIEPNSATAKRNLGLVLVKINKFKEALSLLTEVAPNYPKDSELLYFLGEAYRGVGFEKESIKAYQNALNINPNDLRVIKSISWVYLKTGKYDSAERMIKKSYEKNPLDLQLMLIMTSIDVKKERYTKAIKEMEEFEKSEFKIVSRDQTTAETEKILLLNVLGNAYAGINDCIKAQKIFDIVLKSRPFLAPTLTDSAKCDLKANNTIQAKGKLEKAYSSEPDYPEALYLLGKIYSSNNPKKAAFYYKKFIEISSDDKNYENESKEAQDTLTQLEAKNLDGSKKSD